jgi:hypothetical protein
LLFSGKITGSTRSPAWGFGSLGGAGLGGGGGGVLPREITEEGEAWGSLGIGKYSLDSGKDAELLLAERGPLPATTIRLNGRLKTTQTGNGKSVRNRKT